MRFKPLILIKIALLVYLFSINCSDVSVNSNENNVSIPVEGVYVIPDINNDNVWGISSNEQTPKNKPTTLGVLTEKQKETLFDLLKAYSQKKNREYVAFFSEKKGNKNNKFKYTYFKLKPTENTLVKADGKKLFYYWVKINPEDGSIVNVLASIVPYTADELLKMKEWKKHLKKKLANMNTLPKKKGSSDCETAENTPPVYNPDTNTYEYGDIVVCDSEDEEISDGNGGGDGGPPPNPDYCYDTTTCEQDTNPDGGGQGSDPTTSCPAGYVKDKDDNCVKGEEPCAGNPIKKPRIASQKNSGLNGGRRGYTRSGGKQFHEGIDIENPVGNAIFSPYDGNIDGYGYDEKGLGYYVTIRFRVNGVYHLMRFAHLQKDSWPPNGSSINAGDVIGIQGTSGNIFNAIAQGLTKAHTHVTTFKRTGGGWTHEIDYTKVNPEALLTTKFDEDGNPIPSTVC